MRHVPRVLCLSLPLVVAAGCAEPDPAIERSTSAATVCATGATTPGVDVSRWHGNVDWAKVKAAGQQFALIRATDGTGTLDDKFATNWAGAAAAGLVRGAYHFFRPGQDAAQQAAWVMSTVGALAPGDLPIAVDVEATEGQSNDSIVAGLRTFIDAVGLGTGKQPIILTAPSFWNGVTTGTELASQPLWVMSWEVSCPTLPKTWSNWAFWMTSSLGSVPGISGNADLDVFNGDLNALKAFANPGTGADAGTDAGAADAAAADDAAADDAGATDASATEDGATDGARTDTGNADSGATDAARPDAPPADVSYASDGGATDGRDAAAEGKSGGGSGGCGCTVARPAPPSLLALAIALLVLRSRRRRAG